jgi:glycosyltransferase involved in cell wall biosynthesis
MGEPPDAPEISVVVPAYRAEATIGGCIAALRRQVGTPRFEVVVVDSSPDDATAAAVAAALARDAGPPPLRLERSSQRLFPGTARNRGAALARAPWLLFLDADCLAAPDLVQSAARARSSGAVAIGGAIARGGSGAVSARLRHLLEFKESLPGVPARATWTLPSACLLVERSAFERHGRFPDTRASEDWLLDWRMWQAGCAMRFDPRMRVEHLTAAGWRPLVRYLRVLGFASGAARRAARLPGQSVVRWPVLAAGLPLARTLRALVWCARYSRRDFAFLLLAWPAYLALAAVWAAGFHAGVRGASREPALAAKDARA